RVTLGLPPSGPVSFAPAPGSTVHSSQPITAAFSGPLEGQVGYGGTCLSAPGTTPVGGTTMQLGVDVDVPAGSCTFTLTFTPAGGQQQTVEVIYDHSGEPSIELLSRDQSGTAAGGQSPSASDDGSVVGFISDGPLAPGVTAGTPHVYVHRGGEVEQVDVTPEGSPASGPIGRVPEVAVSSGGGHVAFTSEDQTLDPQGPVDADISGYVRDLAAGTTRHVSVDAGGAPIPVAQLPSLSADGAVVTYRGRNTLWWHILTTGEVGFVQDAQGQPIPTGAGLSRPQLSAEGRYITFQTDAALLTADDNDGADVYLYDIAAETLELISVAPDGTAGTVTTLQPQIETGISGDGRYVVFAHAGGDLVAGEEVDPGHIYLRDRQAGTTVRISQGGSGVAGSASGRPQISDDGSWVVFSSDRTLIPSTQGGCGVYRYDLAAAALDRVDLGATTGGNANCPTRMDVAAGGAVVFDHVAALHIDDDHTGPDVYRAAPRQGG
ncbi:MAG TPA: hypothetical protein VMM13_20870, partial [Euzebya sp.]|nr:hypothetical protein [Euzebya sp.]